MSGCISNIKYNGLYLDTEDPKFVERVEQNVDENCACNAAEAAFCKNGAGCLPGGTSVACLCLSGFRGPDCGASDVSADDGNIFDLFEKILMKLYI